MAQCPSCGNHSQIHTVEIDPKTKKKWDVTRCSRCEHPTDLEPYKPTIKKTKIDSKLIDPYEPGYFNPFP